MTAAAAPRQLKPRSRAAALSAWDSDADLRTARIRLGEALPDEGWLGQYLRAVVPLTDAPVEFHLASGLCAVAAVLGNSVRVESWGQNVFPHLWAVLVAPSSFWRKSTSIGMAESLVAQAVPTAILPTEFSREALLKNLSERPAGMFALKEFGGFLSMLGRDYMAGAKENLTELYDGPEKFVRLLKKETVEVSRPALTILGATTLDWLESKITDGDLRSGFLARFLFVTAREKAAAKAITTAMDPGDRIRLIEGLRAIAEAPGGLARYGPGAEEALNDWIMGWEREVTGTRHRADLSGFAVRLQTYALKLAMVYQASHELEAERTTEPVLEEASVRRAIAYCRVLWANVANLIDEDIAITRDARELRRLVGIIGNGVDRSRALRVSKLQKRDFDNLVATLVASGQIVVTRVRAHDVGLDRERNSEVEWLQPAALPVPSSGSAGVPGSDVFGFAGIPEEFEGNSNEAEPEGTLRAVPERESSNSSSSSSSPMSHDDDDGYTREGDRELEALEAEADLPGDVL